MAAYVVVDVRRPLLELLEPVDLVTATILLHRGRMVRLLAVVAGLLTVVRGIRRIFVFVLSDGGTDVGELGEYGGLVEMRSALRLLRGSRDARLCIIHFAVVSQLQSNLSSLPFRDWE